MTSKIFTARNNLTIDGNFSPNIIFVRSSNTNTTITITITDSVNVDEIFMVKCFTTATIITSSWNTTLQNGSCIAFTRLNIISTQPIRSGESVAVISMSNQSISVNNSAIISNISDSASEIGIPSANLALLPSNSFVYYSTTGGLIFIQTFISRSGLTATNSSMELFSCPTIPGMDTNITEATLIPVLTQNIQNVYGMPFECSASSEFSSQFEAYRGFTNHGSWYTAGTTTGWFQIKLPFTLVADRIDITTATESVSGEGFTKWEILGSNDGVTFKRLLYSGNPIPRKNTRYHFTENVAPYRWYRFNGLEGTGVNCGITELQLYAKYSAIQLLNTSPFVRNDGYTISKTIVLNMPANIPVFFWFSPSTWVSGNFSGYCIIRK